MVDDTRLELVDAAAGGVHPRQSVRAMPGLEWSQVRVYAFGQKQKLRSQATTEFSWWTIQDSNLRLQPQAACIRGDPSGRCPDSNGHKFESVLLDKNKTPQSSDYGVAMVDDTRLELVTSRTSSGCATSCANRPALYQRGIFYIIKTELSRFFCGNISLFAVQRRQRV